MVVVPEFGRQNAATGSERFLRKCRPKNINVCACVSDCHLPNLFECLQQQHAQAGWDGYDAHAHALPLPLNASQNVFIFANFGNPRTIWSTQTTNMGTASRGWFCMSPQGELVLWNGSSVVWESNTGAAPFSGQPACPGVGGPYTAVLQQLWSDPVYAYLIVYDRELNPLWTTQQFSQYFPTPSTGWLYNGSNDGLPNCCAGQC